MDSQERNCLYFDGAADTAVAPDVFYAMKPFMSDGFVGNAHSIHDYGIKASMALEESRKTILNCFNLDPNKAKCFFTSGATESNNWAIQSTLSDFSIKGKAGVVLVGSTDHDSIRMPAAKASQGTPIIQLEPTPKTGSIGSYGALKAIDLILKMKPTVSSVFLLAISAVNNETGAINDVKGICDELKKANLYPEHILVDCTQALSCGKSRMDLVSLYPAESWISFGAHKIFGPEGIGALICMPGVMPPRPFIVGGEQENGFRAGTSNVSGAVGLATAVKLIDEMDIVDTMKDYRDIILKTFTDLDPECHENGQGEPNILSVTLTEGLLKRLFPNYTDKWTGDLCAQLFNTELGIAVSAGAACSASSIGAQPSHVLLAMGMSPKEIARTIRFSFSGETPREDIVDAVDRIKQVAERNKQ